MPTSNDYRSLFVGLDVPTPLLSGAYRCYTNFDNAASTPPLKAVQQSVDDFLVYYSSVHRGMGFKSQLSTHVYERARQITMEFVAADPNEHTCIFVKNTTEAVNKLARRFPFSPPRDVVLTTGMEHHSNDLPWRVAAHTVHIALTADGRLDEADFDDKLQQYAPRLALVTVTAASNVTGFLNPVHRLAEKAHAVGAMIMVDCAQFAPHRQVDMRPLSDPGHLDFITISAHKMYAPFGSGALIGRMDVFSKGDPDVTGGGTVEIVTLDDVVYTNPPDRDEAGSPNTVGAVAMAAAIQQLEKIGMGQVAQHEAELTAYALQRLPEVPGLQIYGDKQHENAHQRLGVIPIILSTKPHFLASAILGYEFGIGVRSGCFCAHPYILHLLGLSNEQARGVRQAMLAGDKSNMPGLIRISFGLYNTIEEIDYLLEALKKIVNDEYQGSYKQVRATGEYLPVSWKPNFAQYFKI